MKPLCNLLLCSMMLLMCISVCHQCFVLKCVHICHGCPAGKAQTEGGGGGVKEELLCECSRGSLKVEYLWE